MLGVLGLWEIGFIIFSLDLQNVLEHMSSMITEEGMSSLSDIGASSWMHDEATTHRQFVSLTRSSLNISPSARRSKYYSCSMCSSLKHDIFLQSAA